MTNMKEFNLLDVRKNSKIIKTLNQVYKLWGYEEVSPSMINNLETIKAREVINQDELVSLGNNNSLCLRPEMTTSIVKLISTRLINKKRPLRLWNNGTIFERKKAYKNSEKLREKIQSGIELIGYETKFPEIEVINILFDCIYKLNLKDNCKFTFLVSSTTIMKLILNKYINNNYEEVKKSMINLDFDALNKLNINDKEKKILKDLFYSRGEPNLILNKLSNIFGNNNVLKDLKFLFNTIAPISNKYGIQIQLDPTFQPHLNLYEGIVFQLICKKEDERYILAKGGRYDELVKYFNPMEKTPNGLGFSISVDNLRNVIKDDEIDEDKVLIVYKNNKHLQKAMEEQKLMQDSGIVTILEINPCCDSNKAKELMIENNCTEIKWID